MKVYRENCPAQPNETDARFLSPALRGTSGERAGERGFIKNPSHFTEEFCPAPMAGARDLFLSQEGGKSDMVCMV